MCRFDSCQVHHVGASFVSLAPIFMQKSERTHAAVSPLRKKSRSAHLLGCKRPRDGYPSLHLFAVANPHHHIMSDISFVICWQNALALASAFFNEIHPYGWVKYRFAAWNTPTTYEIASAKGGFYFTFRAVSPDFDKILLILSECIEIGRKI